MKSTVYTVSRLTPTTQKEKAIRNSWKNRWAQMGRNDQKGGTLLVFGDWSGYNSSQYRITHCTLAGPLSVPENYRGTVFFTDNTSMTVWTKRVTREEILRDEIYYRDGYSTLIDKLVKSGSKTYHM